MVKKRIAVLTCLMILFSVFSLTAFAGGTGKSYVYNHLGDPTEIPDPYQATAVLGSELGLSSPEDMAIYNNELYILDSGNKRIVVVDSDYKFVRQIDLHTGEGEITAAYTMTEPKGIWVDENGLIYIADRTAPAIIIADNNGLVLHSYGKPNTSLMSADVNYLPLKVLTDSLGTIYVQVEGEYRGFVMLDPDTGEFLGYFGSNDVAVTSEVLSNLFWRNFMSDEAIARTTSILPMEYSNFTIKGEFIYGVRGTTTDSNELIRKLNCKSANVLENTDTDGEDYLGSVKGVGQYTNFNAITVDDDGFITVLDSTMNRIIQYTAEGYMMYIFGGTGEQAGTFKSVVDIESWGDQLLVLDKTCCTVTVMTPTSFGNNIRTAETLFSQGDFESSLEPWKAVLDECMNYEFAYEGIGKALYMEGQYEEAMAYYKLADDESDYSDAFQLYRADKMQGLFTPVMVVILSLLAVWSVYGFLKRRGVIRTKKLVLDESGKLKYLAHVTLHPIEGYEEMRYNRKYSLCIGNVLAALFVFSQILSAQYTGSIFNLYEENQYNIFLTLASSIGVLALFTLANWLMATFLEGKGPLKEVWIYLGYAMLPMTVGTFLYMIFSNLLTQDEGVFLVYLSIVMDAWTGIMVFFAIKGLHMYTVKRTVVSILVTLFAMLCVLFIIFLMLTLFIQLSSFFETIYKEAMYRIVVGF